MEKKMLLTSSLLIKGALFQRQNEPLTRKLPYQKHNTKMEGFLGGTHGPPVRELSRAGVQQPAGLVSVGAGDP